jgi:hypothetical protein
MSHGACLLQLHLLQVTTATTATVGTSQLAGSGPGDHDDSHDSHGLKVHRIVRPHERQEGAHRVHRHHENDAQDVPLHAQAPGQKGLLLSQQQANQSKLYLQQLCDTNMSDLKYGRAVMLYVIDDLHGSES